LLTGLSGPLPSARRIPSSLDNGLRWPKVLDAFEQIGNLEKFEMKAS
jgi:hypothetical protein